MPHFGVRLAIEETYPMHCLKPGRSTFQFFWFHCPTKARVYHYRTYGSEMLTSRGPTLKIPNTPIKSPALRRHTT